MCKNILKFIGALTLRYFDLIRFANLILGIGMIISGVLAILMYLETSNKTIIALGVASWCLSIWCLVNWHESKIKVH